jgi:hypothetical protein
MSTGPLSHPIGQDEPKRYRVGQVIEAKPGIFRRSRAIVLRGYYIVVARKVDAEGQVVETTTVFKPALQYDRAVLSTNKYRPHQGKKETLRRLARV